MGANELNEADNVRTLNPRGYNSVFLCDYFTFPVASGKIRQPEDEPFVLPKILKKKIRNRSRKVPLMKILPSRNRTALKSTILLRISGPGKGNA